MYHFEIMAPHPVQCWLADEGDEFLFRVWIQARRGQVLGLDSEANTRDPWERGYACRLIQISDGIQCWVLPPFPWLAKYLREHPRFVGHFTARAEVPFIERGLPGSIRLGELDPHIIDYQVAQAIIDPRTLLPRKDGIDVRLVHKKGLKDSYRREVDPCLADAEKRLHLWFHDHAPVGHRTAKKAATWGFEHVPLTTPEYLEYSAMDAVAVKVLYDRAVVELKRTHRWEQAVREFELQWDIDNMVFRGDPVDPPYVRWLAGQLDDVVTEEAAWLAPHGIPKSAMGGTVHTAFAALGQAPVRWNKGKIKDGVQQPDTPCWDKWALIDLLDAPTTPEPVAQLAYHIMTVRRAGKFKETYVQPMLDSLDRDYRIHPQFRSIGTITHRNSASDPPVQQLPKNDKRVRAAIGGVPGWVYVTCDLEQGEPRTMAGIFGDPNYVAAVNSGDVNSQGAADTFGADFIAAEGKKAGTPSFIMRQMFKIGHLSVCYGVGVDKLASQFKVSKDQAATFRSDIKTSYKVMFAEAAKDNAKEYVTLPSGRQIILWDRKIALPDGRVITSAKPSRKALNYKAQGAQADWVKAAWLRLRPKWSWALAILMHDEIVLHVPEAFAAEAMADLERAMSGPIGHGVMMTASAEVAGATWAEQPADFDRAELESVDDE